MGGVASTWFLWAEPGGLVIVEVAVIGTPLGEITTGGEGHPGWPLREGKEHPCILSFAIRHS